MTRLYFTEGYSCLILTPLHMLKLGCGTMLRCLESLRRYNMDTVCLGLWMLLNFNFLT